MKTDQEQSAEAARQALTITVTGPDGNVIQRIDGVACYILAALRAADGGMAVTGHAPPEVAAAMLALAQVQHVQLPYLALAQAQQREATERRIVPATAMPPARPLNGRPRIVVE